MPRSYGFSKFSFCPVSLYRNLSTGTYGRLFANNRSLLSIDRIFVYKRPDVFFNQPYVF